MAISEHGGGLRTPRLRAASDAKVPQVPQMPQMPQMPMSHASMLPGMGLPLPTPTGCGCMSLPQFKRDLPELPECECKLQSRKVAKLVRPSQGRARARGARGARLARLCLGPARHGRRRLHGSGHHRELQSQHLTFASSETCTEASASTCRKSYLA